MLTPMSERRTLVLHVQATGTTWIEDVPTGRRTPVHDLDDLPRIVRAVLDSGGGVPGVRRGSDTDAREDPGVQA